MLIFNMVLTLAVLAATYAIISFFPAIMRRIENKFMNKNL